MRLLTGSAKLNNNSKCLLISVDWQVRAYLSLTTIRVLSINYTSLPFVRVARRIHRRDTKQPTLVDLRIFDRVAAFFQSRRVRSKRLINRLINSRQLRNRELPDKNNDGFASVPANRAEKKRATTVERRVGKEGKTERKFGPRNT